MRQRLRDVPETKGVGLTATRRGKREGARPCRHPGLGLQPQTYEGARFCCLKPPGLQASSQPAGHAQPV